VRFGPNRGVGSFLKILRVSYSGRGRRTAGKKCPRKSFDKSNRRRVAVYFKIIPSLVTTSEAARSSRFIRKESRWEGAPGR